MQKQKETCFSQACAGHLCLSLQKLLKVIKCLHESKHQWRSALSGVLNCNTVVLNCIMVILGAFTILSQSLELIGETNLLLLHHRNWGRFISGMLFGGTQLGPRAGSNLWHLQPRECMLIGWIHAIWNTGIILQDIYNPKAHFSVTNLLTFCNVV